MPSLYYLYKHILINEYRKKFFSKSTLFGAAIIIIFSLFTFGIGFAFGYFVNFSYSHPGLKAGNVFYEIKILFLEIVIPVIILKATSGMNYLRLVNLNTLRIFPVSKFKIFSFDINIGLFDFMSLYFTVFLLALVAGAEGFSISISIVIIFVIFCISLIYFVHILGELVRSIKMLISYLPKTMKITITLVTICLLYFIFFKNLSFKSIINNNPLSWNVSSVFSLASFNEANWVINNIVLNILFSAIGLILIISIRSLHARLFSSHIIRTIPKVKKKNVKMPIVISIFPSKLQPFIEKDLKYLLRSSRSVSTYIIETLFVAFFVYMNLIHSKLYGNFYVTLGSIVILPVMIWDFYLSNCWGLERKGFGFYMYSNTDFNNLIPSKNFSFLSVRLPVILVISICLSILFSFKYFPVIILLYLIISFVSLSFSSIVSIKNPYPVDFKESSFSNNRQQRISWIGFAGLLIDMILPAAILFILFKLNTGFMFYSIMIILLLLLFISYKIMISFSSNLLIKQKEKIYKMLTKI